MIQISELGGNFFGIGFALEPFTLMALVAVAPVMFILITGGVLTTIYGWI